MNNQSLMEENLKLFLTELAHSLALSVYSATGKRVEARVDTAVVLTLSEKITESYHQWTDNYLQPFCYRSELAAVVSVELFLSKPLIRCALNPRMLRPLHNLCVLFSFAYIMGLFVKLAGSPPELRNQFSARFIHQVALAVKQNPRTAVVEMHRFMEKKFPVLPATVHFTALKGK